MQHPLQKQVQTVRRRARQWLFVYGLAWFVALAATAILLAGLTDVLLRFRDPGLRWMSSLFVVGVCLAAFYRFLYPVLHERRGNLAIARRIEDRFPQLGGELSTAVAFLEQPEDGPLAGSQELREAVIAETTKVADGLDFSTCLDTRRPRRALSVALVVAVATFLLAWLGGSSSQLAARRLLMPWGDDAWPRRNQLAFETPPSSLPSGADFEVQLVDRNDLLPSEVEIHYWFEGDPQDQIQVARMKSLGDRMIHRLANVTRPFKFRAVGGDDDSMPWLDLELVEPPRLVSHELLLHPPEYSRLPPRASSPRIRTLVGTLVEMQGRCDKQLRSVEFTTDTSNTSSISLPIGEDGMSFSLAEDDAANWQISRSGSYQLIITDSEGRESGQEKRWEVNAVPDEPPTVSLETPAGNIFVTPDASVTLKGLVKDDLGIRDVHLRYTRSDQSDLGEQTVVLYGLGDRRQDDQSAEPQSKITVDYGWNLQELPRLAPGAWIDFHLAASDHMPQRGQCSSRRLTIISVDQLEDRIAQRQALILNQLAEALRVQRDSRTQTSALQIQLEEAGELVDNDIDQLQSAELNQREVSRILVDPANGVIAHVESLLSDLASNRVDRPEIADRMTQLRLKLRSLGQEQLLSIQRSLIDALKTARAEPTPDDTRRVRMTEQLSVAGSDQDEVIRVLEDLLQSLSKWDSYRRFSREISRLRRDQQDLLQQTDALRLATLTKSVQDLDPREKAAIRRSAERQYELARMFDKLLDRMDSMRGELAGSDPVASETLADVLDLERRLALAGQMRESGRSIERNQVGQAVDQQSTTVTGLQQLLDVLANRREHRLGRVLEQLRQAGSDLEQLREDQRQLQEQIDKVLGESQRDEDRLKQLIEKQQELADQSRRLARRLQRLRGGRAAALVDRAANHQEESARSVEEGNRLRSRQLSLEADERLLEALEEIQREIERTEQDLLQEQLAQLEQLIAGLRARQQNVLTTTEEMHAVPDGLSRAQAATVRDLAAEQSTLADESAELLPRLEQSPAFLLVLRGAVREMRTAAGRLDTLQVGPVTQEAQRQALTRLDKLLTVLSPDTQDPPPGDPNSGATPGSPDAALSAVQQLAELRLILLMQEEIHQQTIALEQQRIETGMLTEDQKRRQEELAREQGVLADMILNLIPPAEDDPPMDPKD